MALERFSLELPFLEELSTSSAGLIPKKTFLVQRAEVHNKSYLSFAYMPGRLDFPFPICLIALPHRSMGKPKLQPTSVCISVIQSTKVQPNSTQQPGLI